MLKAAVIGLGAISQTHIEAIRMMPDARLAAVCDIDPAKRIQGIPFYTDIDTLCREVKPDVVHICLPHYLHVPVARRLASYGIHIFMEKPAGCIHFRSGINGVFYSTVTQFHLSNQSHRKDRQQGFL